ncbi:TM2 domain-containing protein [Azotobacter chroococcum]|uniref:TM2 domain-containing protein n=1 Tax=Azotobacter chroococcum TaxID=353 RepID=UPI0009E2DB6D|nr:TM2 domain-containing protein [Azotobacter chroococcum]
MSSIQAEILVEQKVANARKSTGVAYILLLLFGGFGVHRFYLGQIASGVTLLVITLSGAVFIFPLIITFVWVLVDLFLIPGIVRDVTEMARRDARLEVAALMVSSSGNQLPQIEQTKEISV